MNLARILRHLLSSRIVVQRLFPPSALSSISGVIAECETRHRGEIRFAVEHALDLVPLLRGVTARQRSVQVFSQLGVWDTEENNGVLIYLLLADRDVEIVADRGIHRIVGAEGWEAICQDMEREFRLGHFEAGVVKGIRAASSHLERQFPLRSGDVNELPNEAVVL